MGIRMLALAGVFSVVLSVWGQAEAAQLCGRTEIGSLYVQTVVDGDRQSKAKLVNEATRLIRCLDRQDRLPLSAPSLKGDFANILFVAAVAQGLEHLNLTTTDELERFIRLTTEKGPDHGNRLESTQ